ncbi:MAG TPA: OmpA family protein [Stellaceae bacterium]|nr:OmpA family protein [Stellaceae bacterium]
MTSSRRRLIGHNGAAAAEGDYFASMTDLMLGLIFIFIIMLMVFVLDMRQAEHRMTSATAELTESNLARRDLLRDLAKILDDQLPVTIDEADGTLQLGGDILFPQGSADAYPDALPKLRLLGEALDRVLPCYAVSSDAQPPSSCALRHRGRLDAVYIEGHTDTTPIHTPRFQSNWDLSAARASATYRRLIEAFPALAMLKNDQASALIGVSGYGEYRPVDQSGTAAGMQRNRRIELRFIMATPNAHDAESVVDRVNAERAR